MIAAMRWPRLLTLLMLIAAWLVPALPARAAPRLVSAADLLAAVNDLRRSYGLAPYKADAALMDAAQGHSQYQASIGGWTHSGPGGSTPKSRAAAAGYGDGATIFVSENVAMGSSFSASEVVQMWMGDSLHQNTMLNPSYTDAGTGVASDGYNTYFTLDAGYIAGQAGSGPPVNPTQAAAGTQVAVIPIIMPVVVATPAQDGSITHVVQPGQTLIGIAQAYKIPLNELLSLNKLTISSLIYPQQKLLVQVAQPTATPTATPTGTATNTPTPRPTRTPRPPTATSPPASATASPATHALQATQGVNKPDLQIVIIGGIGALILAGVGLMAYGARRGQKS